MSALLQCFVGGLSLSFSQTDLALNPRLDVKEEPAKENRVFKKNKQKPAARPHVLCEKE